MPEKGQQFDYSEERLMDALDKRRKESGVRVHLGGVGSYESELFATKNGKPVGALTLTHHNGEVTDLRVHPDLHLSQKGVVTDALLKAANQVNYNWTEKGLRPTDVTTDLGFRLTKKLAPNSEAATGKWRAEVPSDYAFSDENTRRYLNRTTSSEFTCPKCFGQGYEPITDHPRSNFDWDTPCTACRGTGKENYSNLTLEKTLNWE
jgi:hypothetical protein